MAEIELGDGAKTPPGPYSYTAEKRAAEKRKHGSTGTSTPKRHHGTQQTDPVFGQTSALPSSHDPVEDDGDSRECSLYMHTVRAEAIGMTSFITASVPMSGLSNSTDHNSEEDTAGYFEDGAYVALPVQNEQTEQSHDENQDGILNVQCQALCDRFERHRVRMRTAPSVSQAAALDQSKHPVTIPPWSKRNPGLRLWRHHLQASRPNLVQLTLMDNRTVLSVLGYVEDLLKGWSAKLALPPQLGSWVWALLGRLEHVEQLTTDEVGVVRSLAKTAIQLFARYRAKLRQNPDEDHDDDVDDTRDDLQSTRPYDDHDTRKDTQCDKSEETDAIEQSSLENLIAAKKMELSIANQLTTPVNDSTTAEAPQDTDTLAILETIIIVAGELYGQKDLLNARDYFWEYDVLREA